jgi:hypothetical protein
MTFKAIRKIMFKLGFIITSITLINSISSITVALPPPEDIPEEILRSEIITEGRSPLDNQALSAREYAELKAELARSKYPPQLNPKIKQIIFLLKLRQLTRFLIP